MSLKSAWPIIIFTAIGFIIFSNGLKGDFVYDDQTVLSHSYFENFSQTLNFFSQPYFEDFTKAGLYRPLTQISFAFNFLFSRSPFGFHLFNLTLHIANSILAFFVLRRLTNSSQISFVAGLLFLVLPIHVEAVTSIVGRAELLVFLFSLLTILFWLRDRALISAIMFLLALLSKETAVVLPMILLLFSLSHSFKKKWWWYFGTVLGIYFAVRMGILGEYAFSAKPEFIFNPLAYTPFFERLFTALKILAIYIKNIFIPINLSPDYSFNQIPGVKNIFSSAWALVGLGILAAIIWPMVRYLRNRQLNPLVLASILFFFPYFLISNLVFPIGTIMGDRLMYLPSLGALLALSFILNKLIRGRERLFYAIIGIVVVFYGWQTFQQNIVWQTQEKLFTTMYERSPKSVAAKTNYGIMKLGSDPELARSLASSVYEEYPDYIQNLNLMAAISVMDKRFEEAAKFLERALGFRPYHQNTLHNLSRVYATLGRYDQAEKSLSVLASRYGGEGNVIFYTVALCQNGKFDLAIQIIQQYFGLNTSNDSAIAVLEYAELSMAGRTLNREITSEFTRLSDSFLFSK